MQKQMFLEQLTFEEVQARFGYELFEMYCEESHRSIERVKRAFEYPSCFTCIYRVEFEDRSVGIWLHVEDCNCPKLTPEQLGDIFEQCEDEKEMAHVCGQWTPDWEAFKTTW